MNDFQRCIKDRRLIKGPVIIKDFVQVGSNTVTGLETKDVMKGIKDMLNKDKNWKNPFGDGKASTRMIERVRRCLDEK